VGAVSSDNLYAQKLLTLIGADKLSTDKVGIEKDQFRIYDAENLQKVIRELCIKGIEESEFIDIRTPVAKGHADTIAVILDIFVKFVVQSYKALLNATETFSKITFEDKKDTAIVSYVKIRIDNTRDKRYKYDERKANTDGTIKLGYEPKVYNNEKRYPYEALYGPFTRVFDYNKTNEYIGENMKEVITKLDSGKNVLIMALGPSGAGKTATLIGRRDKGSGQWIDGCIPSMLSKLQSDVDRITLTGKEMKKNYKTEIKSKDYYSIESVYTPETLEIVRNTTNGKWELQNPPVGLTASYYMKINKETNKEEPSGICEKTNEQAKGSISKEFNSGDTLGSIMADMVERRLNCGTSNNPDSSRSHLILIMKLHNKKQNTTCTLAVADLAGREKKFSCTETDVLQAIITSDWYPNIKANAEIKDKGLSIQKTQGNNTSKEDYAKLVKGLVSGSPIKKVNEILGQVSGTKSNPSGKYKDAESYAQRITNDKVSVEEEMKKQLGDKNVDIAELGGVKYSLIDFFFGVADKLQTAHEISKKWTDTGIPYSYQTPTGKKFIPELDNLINLYEEISLNMSAGTQAREVCEIRSQEGEFINKSLDDFERAIRYVISTSEETRNNIGPLVNDICFPINCTFADTTCFVNKKEDIEKDKAIEQIFGNDFFTKLTVCPFLVVDFTEKPTTRIYTPYEDQIREILSHIDKALFEKELITKLTKEEPDKMNLKPLEDFISNKLSKIISAIQKDFNDKGKTNAETALVYNEINANYKEALKTAEIKIGIDTTEGANKYEIHKLAFEDKEILTDLMTKYENALRDVSAENGNTAPGIMWNVDNMMKYYLTGRKRCVISM
jgi:hypothetical protein